MGSGPLSSSGHYANAGMKAKTNIIRQREYRLSRIHDYVIHDTCYKTVDAYFTAVLMAVGPPPHPDSVRLLNGLPYIVSVAEQGGWPAYEANRDWRYRLDAVFEDGGYIGLHAAAVSLEFLHWYIEERGKCK